MRTWGETPSFDDVAWEEQAYGRDAVREHYREPLECFPDLCIETHKTHVSDDAVILEVTVSGTHLGDWRGLLPMRRRMESRVCAMYTFDEAGLLKCERTYYDKGLLPEQLGIFADRRTRTGRAMAVLTPPFTILRAFGRKPTRRRPS